MSNSLIKENVVIDKTLLKKFNHERKIHTQLH